LSDGVSEEIEAESQEDTDVIAMKEKYKKAKWTKVIKLTQGELPMINIFSLLTDLEELDDLPSYARKKKKAKWEMIFDPDIFEEANPDLEMEQWKLTELKLKNMAVVCSELREGIRNQALMEEINATSRVSQIEKRISRLGKKIEKGWHRTGA
jgi:hypothetical protein